MSKGLAAWEVSPDCHAAAAPSVCGQEMRPDKSRRQGQEKQRPPLPGYCHWGKSRGVGEGKAGGGETRMMRGWGKEGEQIWEGTRCGYKQKKGWGSHCHANWCSVQTLVSCKEKEEAKVREGVWHRLVSRVDIVSFCERCCRLGLFDS